VIAVVGIDAVVGEVAGFGTELGESWAGVRGGCRSRYAMVSLDPLVWESGCLARRDVF